VSSHTSCCRSGSPSEACECRARGLSSSGVHSIRSTSVIRQCSAAPSMPELDLFDKTELWLVGIALTGTRLPDLAAAAASALSLRPSEVFVTDVRADHVVFDVLASRVEMANILGRERDLLSAVAAVPGVVLNPGATLHSRGVLGIIGAPKEQVAGVLASATALEVSLRKYVSRRVVVVSTGAEVDDGRVHDTNLDAVRELMTPAGFEVSFGGVVGDVDRAIAGRIARLAEEGFGTIITTGGVGAEDKDRTIEALELLGEAMPGALVATAALATYEVGHGRHVKPHVRVGAAMINDVLVVSLPGPTREVRAAIPALIAAIHDSLRPDAVAEAVAVPIRALWRSHGNGHVHHRTNEREAL
jgi:molybdenum cofactor synthesis domain-containing protein